MYTKKIVFSTVSLPVAVLTHNAHQFQKRRQDEKLREIERRNELLAYAPVDITPKGKGSYPWEGRNAHEFEADWSFKTVKVTGFYEHEKEIQIERLHNGERGVQIITPFYTHVNNKGEAQGVMIDRGWVPRDILESRVHHGSDKGYETVTGVLTTGDQKQHNSALNEPSIMRFTNIYPEELGLVAQIPQPHEIMLMKVDLDTRHPTILPSPPTPLTLVQWPVSPQRHGAYSELWNKVSFAAILSNVALWLYF